ncbi:MAG: polyprenyl synthetase family protein [Dysgonamonadaceae bacterium]|jgi:geranylgeranyl diphosphate synthase type II|nr:polyprenyl synthetase family protein [Dysgonamonadaceae bacterium]
MITFEQSLDIIRENIAKIIYPSHPDQLYAPIRYILDLGGKRARPALVLLACNLYKDDVSDSIQPALAWEVFHNFTLMHDDVMDHADIRRGKPTVHKVWNENTAILSGDSMLILAYQILAKAPADVVKPLLDLFSKTAAEICEGQQLDMEFEARQDVTEEEYLEMICLKTAVMMGACLKSGAMVGGAKMTDMNLLYEFGINLGLAFQIKDDLLDIYGNPAVFGKAIGRDILCNKKTYFLVNALRLAGNEDKKSLLNWLEASSYNENEKIRGVTAIYDKLLLKQHAEEKMKILYEKSLSSLEMVDLPERKKTVLYEFAKQLMEREH